jgi:enterochelin esterase-like enzyme
MSLRILFLFAVAGVSATTAAQQQAPSPEVGTDRRVSFRLLAPNAREVRLSGEFMQGSTPLVKNEAGLWSVTVGPLEPEIYHYTFTVDGVRIIDPGNPAVKTGSTSSTLASVLEVRGDTPAFYDEQPVPHGDIRSHVYASRSLGTERRLTVYTPPGYEQDSKAMYPVLYLLHGANADENAWHRLGRVNLILDNLIAAGKARPFLIVMPFGYGIRPGGAAAPGQNTALFGKDLIEDVIPYIQSRYRAASRRDQRAIAGLSMGGGQALSIGLNNLDLFSHMAGFSSGLGAPADFPKTYAGLIARGEKAGRALRLLWVGCGIEDGAMAASRSFSAFLHQHGIVHTFRETPGAHTWMVWRRHINEVAPLLFQS